MLKRREDSLPGGAAVGLSDLVRPLVKNGMKRQVKAGDIILHQGEDPGSACLLVDGIAKVYNISASGEEQLINFHLPYEIFPTPWLFKKTSRVLYFYQAQTDCEVYLYDQDDILAHIHSNQQILSTFLDYYVNNYIGCVIRLTALGQQKAKDKIIYTLYYLMQKYGKNHSKQKIQLRIQLTHQEIASLVGLTRETAAVEMKKLERSDVLTYNKHTYIINKPKLLEAMGEDAFRDLKLR